MEKLSSTKVAGVLGQVGPALRALSEENTALKEKVAFYVDREQRREKAEKIAAAMETKNLDTDLSRDEKVTKLMGAEDLDVIEKAVDMTSQQVKLASISDHPDSGRDAVSAFEAAIMSD